MIQASDFIEPAWQGGWSFWAGVPCSFLTPFINGAIQDSRLQYVAASSEGEAVAAAVGAFLAGTKPVVICQNSGLGNMVNPLTSLAYPFRIPLLLIVTHRGAPGIPDEPQHVLMGQITTELLDTLRVPHLPFPLEKEKVGDVLEEVQGFQSREQLPFSLVMSKGSVAPYPLMERKRDLFPEITPVEGHFVLQPERRMRRGAAIRLIREFFGGRAALVATTGKTGRELFTLGHSPNQFYVIGGMGCAAGIGLGLSLGKKSKKIVVIDGDGAILMKMGTLATIGHYQPENLIHIVLDNEAHESTGGQFTVSGSVDLAGVAAACRYRKVLRCDTPEDFEKILPVADGSLGPVMVHVKVSVGSDPGLGRPTLGPLAIRNGFMDWMKEVE